MRSQLRKVAARFTWPVIAGRHLELFYELLRAGENGANLAESGTVRCGYF